MFSFHPISMRPRRKKTSKKNRKPFRPYSPLLHRRERAKKDAQTAYTEGIRPDEAVGSLAEWLVPPGWAKETRLYNGYLYIFDNHGTLITLYSAPVSVEECIPSQAAPDASTRYFSRRGMTPAQANAALAEIVGIAQGIDPAEGDRKGDGRK